MSQYPLIIEAQILNEHIKDDNLLIIDLCKRDIYTSNHIPGAVHFDYGHIVRVEKPVMGLVPDDAHLQKIFSALGISMDTHVIAYDDEGGGKACRLLWTLELAGHHKVSLLNGGIYAWANNALPMEQTINHPVAADFKVQKDESVLASMDYIQEHLDDPQVQILDSRSAAEYRGSKSFARKGGHIPGAIHYEWTDAMDRNNNLCLLPMEQLQQTLADKGFKKDKTIVAYCHSHHRSSFSYYLLKAAGYKQVKGYAGSWSEWGNHSQTPITTGGE